MAKEKIIKYLERFLSGFMLITYPVVIFIMVMYIYMDYQGSLSYASRHEKLLRTQSIGLEIMAALSNYKNNNGQYPDRLDDLVPNYLEKIEMPPYGNVGWVYSAEPNNFYLGAGYTFPRGTLYPETHYSTKDDLVRIWRVND
jgi:phosphoglycerol transferase MdoB-like AlkP superfamily enzyme